MPEAKMSDLEELVALPYDIVIIAEPQPDGSVVYMAEHPDLPGCQTHGKSEDEALLELGEARRLYIESLLERGLEVPRPASGPQSIFQSLIADTATTSGDVRSSETRIDLAEGVAQDVILHEVAS